MVLYNADNSNFTYLLTFKSSTNETFETRGITKLDKEENQCIKEKTGAQNILEEIKQYQKKWLQHVQRMDTNRIPKQALRYRPKDEEHRTTEEEMEGPTSF